MDVTEAFGRERELARTGRFLERAARQVAVLVLEGEAGVGKTTVWREGVHSAEARGFRVLLSRPAEAEAKLAFSAVADLCEAVPDHAFAALPEPQRRTLGVALLRAQPSGGPLSHRTVSAAVRGVLARLADEAPVIVAVEDVQWLDPTSATVLGYALRRLTGAPIGWLLTQRLGQPAQLQPEEHVPSDVVARWRVGPLGRDALHRLLRARFDRPISRSQLLHIEESSRGNPFHALEIARELHRLDTTRVVSPMPVPGDLQTLVAARLRRLPQRTRDELLTAAALSDPDTTLLDEAALGPAEEADLLRVDDLGAVAFTHPLFASAVYRSASRSRRRAVHAALAERVTDAEERSHHLALAATGPDERVAQLLEEGAALARRRGAWDAAAVLLERAAALTPPELARRGQRRTTSAAEHHIHAGDRVHARGLVEALLGEELDGEQRARALWVLGEVSYHAENYLEAEHLLTGALRHTSDPRLVAAIELDIGHAHTFTWDHAGSAVHAARALELAEASGDDSLIAQALAHSVMYGFLCGRGVDWTTLQRSLSLEDPDAVVMLHSRPSVIAALLQLYVGRHDEARTRLRMISEQASERGDESDLAFILLWRSWLETRSGDYDAAADLVARGLTVATLTGSQSNHAWLLAQRALVHAHRGDSGRTRRDCADATALISRFGNGLAGTWVAASLALLELSLGDTDRAWAACEQLTGFVEDHGLTEPVPAFFLPEAIEALIGLAALDRAEALLDTFEHRAQALDRPWALANSARCRTLLLAARGDLAGARAAIDRALAAHERLDMPFELARTLLVAGVVERRNRQRAQARQSFQQALGIFEQLGAPLWAEQARRQLDRIGSRRSSGNGLTSTERRVAELTASGLTNREVASALYVSPKTVEANLTRIYRKLGITSRAELGARMAATPQP